MNVVREGRNYCQGRDVLPGDYVLVQPSTGLTWVQVQKVRQAMVPGAPEEAPPGFEIAAKFFMGPQPPDGSHGEMVITMGAEDYIQVMR